eukprot:jgi/Bigna1/61903/fgenesh1_kg.28_\
MDHTSKTLQDTSKVLCAKRSPASSTCLELTSCSVGQLVKSARFENWQTGVCEMKHRTMNNDEKPRSQSVTRHLQCPNAVPRTK